MIANILIAIFCTPIGKATAVVQSTLRVTTTILSISQYTHALSFLVQRKQSSGYITTVDSTVSVPNINSTTLVKGGTKTQSKRMNSAYDVSIEMHLIIMLPDNY